MGGLQIQLVLGLLPHGAQVRAESRFGDRRGVVAVLSPDSQRLAVLDAEVIEGRIRLSGEHPCQTSDLLRARPSRPQEICHAPEPLLDGTVFRQ
jgi:hypothetical protein